MGAIFEIYIYSDEYMPLNQVYRIFEFLGKNINFIEISSYVDIFLSEKLNSFNLSDEETIKKEVMEGRIIYSCGILCGRNIGVIQKKYGKIIESDLWFDIGDHIELDQDEVNQSNEIIYHTIIQATSDNGISNMLCVFGTELSVDFDEDVNKMIQTSHNASAWMIPKRVVVAPPPKYVIGENDEFRILFKTK